MKDPDAIVKQERQRILAVHESDLAVLLTKLGVMGQIEAGELKCASCGLPITLTNVGVVSKKEGKLQISCNESPCQATLQAGTAK